MALTDAERLRMALLAIMRHNVVEHDSRTGTYAAVTPIEVVLADGEWNWNAQYKTIEVA